MPRLRHVDIDPSGEYIVAGGKLATVSGAAAATPGKSNLPPATDMLRLPNQTLDVPVNFESGTYYYQCDHTLHSV